ncbi:WD repeat, SAM and U-box domain-containing protein 1 isoform X2 [Oryzias latipes]|uniref:WD repeat, SAM and U-box domain-containing protein 1 isoform X2 n=1 Tax=Oryzias latipes TaxID=8090 RepID=UPI0009DAEC54|nr:WD repeat, SAM and U-box domain-containing protein 1 isoform X2 [Oryzias latipes]
MVSLLHTLRDHTDEVRCCSFSPSLLATGSGDKSLRVYSASTGFTELPFSPLTAHGYGVHCCCFSSCGGYLLSCSTDGLALLWSADTGELLATLEHPSRSPLRVCALSPDSSRMLAGACDGTVAQWDFRSRKLLSCSAVSEASVVACCFSPCGQMFVSGCTNGDLKLWDLQASLLNSQKDAHDLGVTCCTFAPQFTIECALEFRLASCGQDSRLKIWIVAQDERDAWTMKLLHSLAAQSAPVLSCAFSPDGELLVSGSVDKSVTIYNANLGTLLHTLKQHDRYVTAVAVSPHQAVIATGSMDRSVNVWRMGGELGETEAEAQQASCQGRKLPVHCRLLLADWTEEDVQNWLCEEGLEKLVDVFKANNIDGEELSRLSKETVTELGIGEEEKWRRSHSSPESVGLRGRLLRRVNALKAEQNGSEAPDHFLCPITRELMKDPVIAADGFSYERESIESWIRGKHKTSPMTNLPLRTTLLTPNRSLKMAITHWKSDH